MRLFITSYQKSGTHQIMPAFGGMMKQIVGRAYVDMAAVRGYGMTGINYDGIPETCENLSTFERIAFGHLPYMKEYADALQAQPTKVLFNVRDPRDVVVANYYNILKIYYKAKPPGKKGLGHLNLRDEVTGELVIKKADPIKALIEIESYRWPEWSGWLKHDFVMMVKYEDLRENPDETVQKIADFVAPYDVDVNAVVGNLKPRHDNPTFRAGRIGDWKKEFTDEHKKLAEKLLGKVIVKLGYEV